MSSNLMMVVVMVVTLVWGVFAGGLNVIFFSGLVLFFLGLCLGLFRGYTAKAVTKNTAATTT